MKISLQIIKTIKMMVFNCCFTIILMVLYVGQLFTIIIQGSLPARSLTVYGCHLSIRHSYYLTEPEASTAHLQSADQQ